MVLLIIVSATRWCEFSMLAVLKYSGIKKGPAVPIQHSWYEPLDNGPPWHKFVFKVGSTLYVVSIG